MKSELDDTHPSELDDTRPSELDDTHPSELDDTHFNELDDNHYKELGTAPLHQQYWTMPNGLLNGGSPVEIGTGPAERKDTVSNEYRNVKTTSSESARLPSDSGYC